MNQFSLFSVFTHATFLILILMYFLSTIYWFFFKKIISCLYLLHILFWFYRINNSSNFSKTIVYEVFCCALNYPCLSWCNYSLFINLSIYSSHFAFYWFYCSLISVMRLSESHLWASAWSISSCAHTPQAPPEKWTSVPRSGQVPVPHLCAWYLLVLFSS